MKLRRAMAAAAATAAIAPIALLSAPAAFATEEAGSAASAANSPGTPPPAGTPTDTATPSPSTPSTPSTPPADTDEPADEPPSTPPAKPAKPAKPPKADKPADELKDGDPKDEEEDAEDGEAEEPLDCPVNEDGVDTESVLEVDLVGLPEKIVTGSGWHRFELSLTNPTDDELGEVKWIAAVNDFSAGDDDDDRLSSYADLQYFSSKADAWKTIEGDVNGGLAFDVADLGPDETVDVKLRVAIDSKAPAGDGYAVGIGGYLDTEQNCMHSSDAYQPITFRKAGSSGETPGTSTPTPDKTQPASVKKPQSESKELPVADTTGGDTGSLAETGSSSMLPTIALAGGAAVVAGAGAMFAVRRRKADTAA
ncbi:LAETG motif-containing sortase-dependent surface protein [Streptomyces sp. NPDC093510]|uniref:LAETG motif-containing sortase-dependent surface protein n=1 Tax=Streptomyces sp. NPDC093510 TaxID=3155199 RepID=UPI00344124B2